MAEFTQKKTVLDRLTDFIEHTIAPPLLKLSQVRYLVAMQETFMVLMPYMLLGATATLVLNMAGLFGDAGFNMPDVAGAIGSAIDPLRPWLLQIVFISINLITLVASVLNGYCLGSYYSRRNDKVSPVAAGIAAMISFLCFIDFMELSANFDWPNYILGAPSLFGGILISVLAVEMYRFLIERNITIKMPASVPPMVANAFTNMIPVSAVVLIAALVGQGVPGFDLLAGINALSQNLIAAGSGPIAQGVGFILDRLLWFVGLHGSNIVSSVMNPVWEATIAANVNAFAAGDAIPYMFTNQWINFYVRGSVFPVALLCCMSKCKRFKVLGKLSLPGTVFNIAEPVMYGLPIVLNPLMFVPWVIGFGAIYVLYAVLGVLGLTPAMVANVVWTMPTPIAAFIGSGFQPVAILLSLLNFTLIFLIFYPFFKVYERQELEREREYEKVQEESELAADGQDA